MDPGSRLSPPLIAPSTKPVSWTVRQIGPTLSSDQHSAMHPLRDTRPYVGRKPVAPQRSDGNVIEPSVSVPIAKPHRPAAVAATLRKSFLRFRTVPKEFALLPRHCVNRRID